MKNKEYLICFLGGIFILSTIVLFSISYFRGELLNKLSNLNNYLGFGFGIMLISYYLIKKKNNNKQDDYTISKSRIVGVILGCLAFVFFGFYLLQLEPHEIRNMRKLREPYFAYGIGILSILFFGLILISSLRTLYIILIKKIKYFYFEGDYFYYYSLYFNRYIQIPTEKIEKFSISECLDNKDILIVVSDEGNYLNGFERFISKSSNRKYGTFYCFSLNFINTSDKIVLKRLNLDLKKYKIN